MIRSRSSLAFLCSALLLACGGGEPATEEALPADTPAPAAAPASPLAAYAGTWSVITRNEAGDSIASYELTANAERTGWTLTFPGRDPLPVTIVEASGDSVVTQVGPYESVLRPGVQVTTRVVNRVQGDRLTGPFVARYMNAGADSVLTGRVEGTRIR